MKESKTAEIPRRRAKREGKEMKISKRREKPQQHGQKGNGGDLLKYQASPDGVTPGTKAWPFGTSQERNQNFNSS